MCTLTSSTGLLPTPLVLSLGTLRNRDYDKGHYEFLSLGKGMENKKNFHLRRIPLGILVDRGQG